MRILDRMRRQQAVYWPPDVPGDDGTRTFAAPVQLRVRWEDKVQEVTDETGTTFVSKSTVYTGEDVATGGAIMLGTLFDVTDAADPFAHAGAVEIKRFDKFPTLRADDFLRTARL